MARLSKLAAAAFALLLAPVAAQAASEAHAPPAHDWSFAGLFGAFDRAELQRGLQVYREVCAGCHGLQYIAFRDLAALGYGEDEIKVIAAEYEVEDGPDDDGEMFFRDALPSDRFVDPFPNVKAAQAANGGAYPPDLTLMVKARAHGADYLRALLIGYEDEPPADVELQEGLYFNAYYAGGQIAMPAPLFEDLVEYTDGTPATVEQMAHDVTAFLTWTASPELEARKRLGIKVILFLLVLAGLLYASKRKLWSKLKY